MTLPKALAVVSLSLFLIIGCAAFFKNKIKATNTPSQAVASFEIELDHKIQDVIPAKVTPVKPTVLVESHKTTSHSSLEPPDADRIDELFTTKGIKLPIVETISYKSHVSWQIGRPAWLSDYASHYSTSRHFIARSLNGKPDYLKQELAEGDKFNVFKKDKDISFRLIIDTSRCKLWLYSIDSDEAKPVLLKSYQVGLGRLDGSKTSGLLTPLGQYKLGDRVAVYKPKIMGSHQGRKVELITIFGSRWIPFEKEIKNCTAPAKGFGIHGTPWKVLSSGERVDALEGIGKYESDGCIRLASPDIEEIFAIIITKPTTIEIVRDFFDSSLANLNETDHDE